MTNLERLKGTGMLIHGASLFADQWGEKLLSSGIIRNTPETFQINAEIPEELKIFFELKKRWPGLQIGNYYRVFSEPESIDGFWVFASPSRNQQLAVLPENGSWSLWVGRWKAKDFLYEESETLRWEGEIIDVEFYQTKQACQLDELLTDIILTSLIRAGALYTADGGVGSWFEDKEESDFIRSIPERCGVVYQGSPTEINYFDYTSRKWFWHPKGLLIEQNRDTYEVPVFIEVNTLQISANTQEGCELLEAEGWMKFNKVL